MIGPNVGPYEIKGEIGHGAMAHVYRAWDTRLQRMVAIKEPTFNQGYSASQQSELSKRFLLEGRAAARLSHPNIVTVYAADEYEGTPVIVMELVEGTTLSSILSRGPLKPDTACGFLDQLLDAVGYAHAHGVIHRDIKPDNIYVTFDGTLKLGDFGIAHLEGTAATALTVSGSMLGTPGYMSPEQVQGTPVDARSDLFSIGVVAYEMLVGHNPFNMTGDTGLATLFHRIAYEPAEPIKGFLTAETPASVSEAIMEALSKDPADRPQSALEFKRMLHGERDFESLVDGTSSAWSDAAETGHFETVTLQPDSQSGAGSDTRLVHDWDAMDQMAVASARVGQGTMTRVPVNSHAQNWDNNGVSEGFGSRGASSDGAPAPSRDEMIRKWLPIVAVGLVATALLFVLTRHFLGRAGDRVESDHSESVTVEAEAQTEEDSEASDESKEGDSEVANESRESSSSEGSDTDEGSTSSQEESSTGMESQEDLPQTITSTMTTADVISHVWKGSYTGHSLMNGSYVYVSRDMTLQFDAIDDGGNARARCVIASQDPKHGYIECSYSLVGSVNLQNGWIRLTGDDWIYNEGFTYMRQFYGTIDLAAGSIVGESADLDADGGGNASEWAMFATEWHG